jgi:cytochrome c oxidase subunit 2
MYGKQIYLFLLAAVLTITGQSATIARADTAPHRIEITAKRFAFEPGEITLKKGEPVVLVLKSADVAHGLRIRDLNVAIKVDARETAQVQFTPQKTGEFIGHCSVFCGSGHGSMAFKVRVVN